MEFVIVEVSSCNFFVRFSNGFNLSSDGLYAFVGELWSVAFVRFGLVWFYCISNIVGYLMSNPLIYIYIEYI